MDYIVQPGVRSLYPSYLSLQMYTERYVCKLKVEGEGSISVQPDMAILNLGVSTESKQVKPAQEENAKKVTEILNTLKAMGIPSKDIVTQSFTIDPEYDYIDGKQVFRNYRVVHSFKVTIRDINEIGEVIDKSVESGGNIVNKISFTVSEPSRYYKMALRVAIDDAVNKAMTIGNKLKVIVSQIPVQITEESYQTESPMLYTISSGAPATTPIQSGQIEISARIEAIFAYTHCY